MKKLISILLVVLREWTSSVVSFIIVLLIVATIAYIL